MSRVGKNPVVIPSGVDVQVAGQTVTAKGKLGQLSMSINPDVAIVHALRGGLPFTPYGRIVQSGLPALFMIVEGRIVNFEFSTASAVSG
jgi:ribosomal protein L6P/L9E